MVTMRIWILTLLIAGMSCSGSHTSKEAEQVVRAAMRVHGSSHFYGSKVSFTFREIEYEVVRKPSQYKYSRRFQRDSVWIEDVLINSTTFTRYQQGQAVDVPDTMEIKYANALNSVLYFFQLPLVLGDSAAFKSYKGTVRIKGEPYEVVKVTFSEESGGQDFQDVFYYWFHKKSHLLDYMAYSYETDGGGVRFREAIGRQEVGGILFQDYINFKAPIGTALADLPTLYQSGQLEQLSTIMNENIQVKRLDLNEGI